MPKLRVMSGREVGAVLESQGFVFARQKGSHRIYTRDVPGGTLSVAVPDHREVAVGTLSGIIRQSQLPRHLFETA